MFSSNKKLEKKKKTEQEELISKKFLELTAFLVIYEKSMQENFSHTEIIVGPYFCFAFVKTRGP